MGTPPTQGAAPWITANSTAVAGKAEGQDAFVP